MISLEKFIQDEFELLVVVPPNSSSLEMAFREIEKRQNFKLVVSDNRSLEETYNFIMRKLVADFL